mmetsp:Transcript_73104/g.144993  ORF Transcript_73104/g.144993 Transcript_73104/m.144993 type:complete len:164 (-) Transcript_73104:838-1329(-)
MVRAPWRTSQRPPDPWLPRPPTLSSPGARMLAALGRRLEGTMTPADPSAEDWENLRARKMQITINMTTLQVLVTPMPTKMNTNAGVVVVVVVDVVVLVIVWVKVVVVVCVKVLDVVVVVLVVLKVEVDVVLVLVGSRMVAVIGLWNSPCAQEGTSLRGTLVLR